MGEVAGMGGRGCVRLTLMAGLAALLSGCTIGSMFGGGSNLDLATSSATPAQITQAAASNVPAIATECPPIRVRQGGATHRSFAGGRTNDAQALRHQAVIERFSRNCVASDGLITLNMGVAGRVTQGPSAQDGAVSVPLRFTVERDEISTFSQRYDVAVQLGSGLPSAEFSQVVENVAIPYVGGETIVIWVGFDS